MLSGLSGIRALAALIVVIYHLNQQLPLDGLGTMAISVHNFIARLSIVVSVFFFLSGFFRSMSYWKVLDTPEKIPLFWNSLKDRFWRIAPAYYITLILSIIATISIHGFSSVNFPALLAGFTFTTWISPETLFPVILNGPLWFVSFDMIGWIVTSLVMMGYFRFVSHRAILTKEASAQLGNRADSSVVGMTKIVGYFLGIILITLGLHFLWIHLPWPESHTFPANYWFPFYNPFLFFLHFLFGIITAGMVSWAKKQQVSSRKIYDISFLIIVVIEIIFLWNIRDNGDDFAHSIPKSPYYFPWIQILIAAGCGILPFTRYIGKWLDTTFFLFTAKLSYSLYLLHGIILALLLEYIFPAGLGLGNWGALVISTFTLSYIAAYVMNRYIER